MGFSVGFLTFFQLMKYQHAVAVRELEFWLAKKKKTNKNIWLTTALDSSTDTDIDVPKKKTKKKTKQKSHRGKQAGTDIFFLSKLNSLHHLALVYF